MAVRLYSEAFDDLIRARLGMSSSLPYKWHPSQPRVGWQDCKVSLTTPTLTQSRLLQLPKELRDEIYKFVIGQDVMVHVTSGLIWYRRADDSEKFYEEDTNEEVYTNDLYFDRCLEPTTEHQLYLQSRKGDIDSPNKLASRACRFQCGFCNRHGHCSEMRGGKVFETAFLQTCRQIHREATTTLWMSYLFSFQIPDTLITFVGQLTPLQQRALKSLHVSITFGAWSGDLYDLMSALASLPGLRNLHLSVKYPCRGDLHAQLAKIRDGSLTLWKEEILLFCRPSLKNVTVVMEDLSSHRVHETTASLHRVVTPLDQSIHWTMAERAKFADALSDKILLH